MSDYSTALLKGRGEDYHSFLKGRDDDSQGWGDNSNALLKGRGEHSHSFLNGSDEDPHEFLKKSLFQCIAYRWGSSCIPSGWDGSPCSILNGMVRAHIPSLRVVMRTLLIPSECG